MKANTPETLRLKQHRLKTIRIIFKELLVKAEGLYLNGRTHRPPEDADKRLYYNWLALALEELRFDYARDYPDSQNDLIDTQSSFAIRN